MPPATRPTPILAIDLVRFGCALLVVAHHYAAMLPLSPPVELAGRVARIGVASDAAVFAWAGWIGVEIFFVVSGYVIALSAAEGSGAGFLRRRALRLAPAAWVCAGVTALVLLADGSIATGEVAGRWLASITFYPLARWVDGSYWTLGIELSFYALVAVQLGGRRGNVAAIERTGLALAAASATFWLCHTGPGSSSRAADLLLLPHGCFFASGIALWAVRRAGWSVPRAAILALGLAAGAAEIVHEARFMAAGLRLDASTASPLAIFAGAVAVIVAADRLQAPLARTIGGRRLATLGLTTYPLYLLHQQIGAIVIIRLREAGVPSAPAMAAAAALSLALALVVVRWAEPAARRHLAAALSRRRAPAPDIPPTASPQAG